MCSCYLSYVLKCVLGSPGMYQVKDVDILHSCAANTDEQEWPVVIRTSDVEYTLQRTLG